MAWYHEENPEWDEALPEDDVPEEPEWEEPIEIEVPEDLRACHELEQLIYYEFLGERLTPKQCRDLLNQARELLERHERDREAINKRKYEEPMNAEFDLYDLYRKQVAEKRAFEFKVLDINIREAASEYDHLIDNLDRPEYEEKRVRLSRLYHRLSPSQKEVFRQKVLDAGLMSEEELDELIEKEVE
jgi:hypothetical protein